MLFVKVQAACDEMQWGEEGRPPLLVKIAPDLSKQDLEDIAVVNAYDSDLIGPSSFCDNVLMLHSFCLQVATALHVDGLVCHPVTKF